MKDSVKDFYNDNSSQRYETRGSISDVNQEYIQMLDDFISKTPNRRILDCGCGVGRDSRYMKSQVETVIGLDLSREQLSYAPKPTVQADMSSLCFIDNSITGVWAPNSIFYLPQENAKQAVAEFLRVLHTDGLCAIGFKIGSETHKKQLSRWGETVQYIQYTEKDARNLVQNMGGEISSEYRNEVSEEKTFLTLFCRN